MEDELLKKLVESWKTEVQIFKIRQESYNSSVKNLSTLNTEIYKKCQELGIDIKSLKL